MASLHLSRDSHKPLRLRDIAATLRLLRRQLHFQLHIRHQPQLPHFLSPTKHRRRRIPQRFQRQRPRSSLRHRPLPHRLPARRLPLCPNRRQGILFKYICTLRYSDESIFGVSAESYAIIAKNPQSVRNPDQFNQNLRMLLANLRGRAASGGPLVKIAAGEERGPSFQTIFALLQCAPDLSSRDCEACLISSEEYICCDNNTGVVVYRPGCFLEYNPLPFYNLTRIEEVRDLISGAPTPIPAPPSIPVPSSPGKRSSVKGSLVSDHL